MEKLEWLMKNVGQEISWHLMKAYLTQRQIAIISEEYNLSYEDAVKMLNAVNISLLEEQHKNDEIIDRINRRLQGEYVIPAWVESLRGK